MAVNSLIHLAEVTATKKVTFIEKWARMHVAIGSKGGLMRAERTRLKSHGGVGFTTGGKVLINPFIECTTVRCVKMEMPSTGGRNTVSAARCAQIELRASSNVLKMKR